MRDLLVPNSDTKSCNRQGYANRRSVIIRASVPAIRYRPRCVTIVTGRRRAALSSSISAFPKRVISIICFSVKSPIVFPTPFRRPLRASRDARIRRNILTSSASESEQSASSSASLRSIVVQFLRSLAVFRRLTTTINQGGKEPSLDATNSITLNAVQNVAQIR
jgi:hypothetical protein